MITMIGRNPGDFIVQTTDRLHRPTDVDRCECEDLGSLVLVDVSTSNPIHCGSCRGEIDPNRLHLTEEETQAIGGWFSVASALNRLWLDSRQYEEYAKIQLSDPQGQVNVEGLQIARALSSKWPTRLWFFHDSDDEEPTQCPVCGGQLDRNVSWGTGCCDRCCVQV
jgi:hypothetical protein